MTVNLFEFEVGSTVNFSTAEGIGAGGGIAFFEDAGISVSRDRIELFALSETDENFALIERIAKKIVSTLPHTPFGAMGSNYNFFDPEPETEVEELFKTPEGIETNARIKEREITTVLARDDDVIVNLVRSISSDAFALSINNHHNDLNVENADALIEGSIRRYLDEALIMCKEYYGYEEHSIEKFELPET